jgi:hypothetical protein
VSVSDRGSEKVAGESTSVSDTDQTTAKVVPAQVPSADQQAGDHPATEMLRRDDIRTGMTLAQTLYAVLMGLGLKVAAESFYPALFARDRLESGALSPELVIPTFLLILLLAIRFSWVPRILYEFVHRYIDTPEKQDKTKTFRPLMLYHFPIALAHTLLFFAICEAFAEMTKSSSSSHAPIIHFVWISIGLLAVNAAWLRWVTPSESNGPGRQIWAKNNIICAVLAGAVLAGFYLAGFSVVVLLLGALAIFFVNSFLDLKMAAENYILFD